MKIRGRNAHPRQPLRWRGLLFQNRRLFSRKNNGRSLVKSVRSVCTQSNATHYKGSHSLAKKLCGVPGLVSALGLLFWLSSLCICLILRLHANPPNQGGSMRSLEVPV